MHENQLDEAVHRLAEHGGGPEITLEVDLDKSTVILGSPGLYDQLVIAQWR
jgi:hypothetical protein